MEKNVFKTPSETFVIYFLALCDIINIVQFHLSSTNKNSKKENERKLPQESYERLLKKDR